MHGFHTEGDKGVDEMKYLTLSVTATLATLISGTASAADETIAVFTKNQTNPYFQAVRIGTETAAKKFGVPSRIWLEMRVA